MYCPSCLRLRDFSEIDKKKSRQDFQFGFAICKSRNTLVERFLYGFIALFVYGFPTFGNSTRVSPTSIPVYKHVK